MKRQLTWFEPRKVWKKRWRGRTFYCGKGRSRNDLDGYLAALEWWRAKKAELEQATRPAVDPAQILALLDLVDVASETPSDTQRDALRTLAGVANFPTELLPQGNSYVDPDQIQGLIERSHSDWKSNRKETVGGVAERFISEMLRRAESDQITAGRYANLKNYTEAFRDSIGGHLSVDAINSKALKAYHTEQLAAVAGGHISSTSANNRMQGAKQFVRYVAEDLELIDPPRNLRSRSLSINLDDAPIVTIPVEYLRSIVEASSGVLRLAILLMANCGMTQKDVADLSPDEVDWEAGTITRKRSKTHRKKNVQAITYRLWPCTFALLKKCRSTSEDHVLLTRQGNPLVAERIKDGKPVRTDALAKKYKTLGFSHPLKAIRATSATLIGNHPEFNRFDWYFLGHAPQTVKDRHYVEPSQDQFECCIRWLGEHYAF